MTEDNNKEPSEIFLRALKEYKEIMTAGGLKQDDTADKVFETQKAMIDIIFTAGYNDGLSKEFIKKKIEDVVEEVSGKKLEDRTLYEMLQTIVTTDPSMRTLPHDKLAARSFFDGIMNKFRECTVEERRTITRSDEEFYEMIKQQVATTAGFTLEEFTEAIATEAAANWKSELETLEIPKIPRGNELFWFPPGDPEPEPDSLGKELQRLAGIIIKQFQELYPDLYSKLRYAEELKTLTMVLNASHNDKIHTLQSALDEAQKEDDYYKFDELALPMLINGLVMSFLVKKDNYVNTHHRKQIYNNILNAVNKELEK